MRVELKKNEFDAVKFAGHNFTEIVRFCKNNRFAIVGYEIDKWEDEDEEGVFGATVILNAKSSDVGYLNVEIDDYLVCHPLICDSDLPLIMTADCFNDYFNALKEEL